MFGPESKQLGVYNLTARPIIDSVLEGYNGKSLGFLSQGSHLLFFALLEFLLILFKGVSPSEGYSPVLFLLWPLNLKPEGTCCSEYSVVVPTMIINSGRLVMNKTQLRSVSFMFLFSIFCLQKICTLSHYQNSQRLFTVQFQ